MLADTEFEGANKGQFCSNCSAGITFYRRGDRRIGPTRSRTRPESRQPCPGLGVRAAELSGRKGRGLFQPDLKRLAGAGRESGKGTAKGWAGSCAPPSIALRPLAVCRSCSTLSKRHWQLAIAGRAAGTSLPLGASRAELAASGGACPYALAGLAALLGRPPGPRLQAPRDSYCPKPRLKGRTRTFGSTSGGLRCFLAHGISGFKESFRQRWADLVRFGPDDSF